MIPVAAFAVTVTGASAFNSDMLEKLDINLTDTQISALEEAHELKQAGAEREDVKAVIEAAGLDRDDLKEIRQRMHEVRKENRAAVKAAVEANDYNAFTDVAPEKLTDAIDSAADFAKLVEAHELREAGDKEGAKEIMAELGIEKPERGGHKGGMHGERPEQN